MQKYIFTFGSSHLTELKLQVNPMKVILVVEAETMVQARNKVFNSFIGAKWAFSYNYDHSKEFQDKYGMIEYTLAQLEDMRNED